MANVCSIAGWSPPGRSVRPIDPANNTSPENRTAGTSSGPSYGVVNVTEPRVWPGVWSTVKLRPASSRLRPSLSSETSSGSANSCLPPSSIRADSALMPAIGSVSRCRSSGWIQAVASYVPQTGSTENMWSM